MLAACISTTAPDGSNCAQHTTSVQHWPEVLITVFFSKRKWVYLVGSRAALSFDILLGICQLGTVYLTIAVSSGVV